VKLVAHNSYGEAIETYEELVGLKLSKTTVWDKVQQRGEKMRAEQMKAAEQATSLPKAQEIIPGMRLEAINKGVSMDGAFVYIVGEVYCGRGMERGEGRLCFRV